MLGEAGSSHFFSLSGDSWYLPWSIDPLLPAGFAAGWPLCCPEDQRLLKCGWQEVVICFLQQKGHADCIWGSKLSGSIVWHIFTHMVFSHLIYLSLWWHHFWPYLAMQHTVFPSCVAAFAPQNEQSSCHICWKTRGSGSSLYPIALHRTSRMEAQELKPPSRLRKHTRAIGFRSVQKLNK